MSAETDQLTVGTCSGCARELVLVTHEDGTAECYHPWHCFYPEHGGRREPCPGDPQFGNHPPVSYFVR